MLSFSQRVSSGALHPGNLAGMTTLENLLQNVMTCRFTLSATDSPDLHLETQ